MDVWRSFELMGIRTFFGLLFSVCLLQPVICQDVASESNGQGSFELRISEVWGHYLQAKESEDEKASERFREEFKQECRIGSAEIFELGSYLLVKEGFADLKKGKLKNAREEFLEAIKLNPYSWAAYEGLGLVKRQDANGFTRYLSLSMKGMRHSFSLSNAFFVLDIAHWFLTTFLRAFMALLILFSLIMCGKYLRQSYTSAHNGFEERNINSFFARLLAVCTLCIPPLLGLNLYLTAALYLVLFLPFFETRERLATVFVLLTPLLIPLCSFFTTNVSEARVDASLRAQLTQYAPGDIASQLKILELDTGSHTDLNLLVVGLLQKSEGDLRGALATFSKIASSSAWFDHSIVNMGNIRFLAKEYQEALEQYQKIGPNSKVYPIALYNQGILKSKQGAHDEAEQFKSRASNSSSIRDRVGTEGLGVVLDATPDNDERLLTAISGFDQLNTHKFLQTFGPGVILSMTLLLLGWLHVRSRNARLLAKSCDKCGRVFFPSDSPESDWCSQCVTLYVKKDDLPSEAKLRKHDEVTRFSRRRRQGYVAIQLLLPGSKKMVTGNAVSGLFTLGCWLVLVFFCLNPVSEVRHLTMRFINPPVLLTYVTFGVTAVYWLIFGLRPSLKES